MYKYIKRKKKSNNANFKQKIADKNNIANLLVSNNINKYLEDDILISLLGFRSITIIKGKKEYKYSDGNIENMLDAHILHDTGNNRYYGLILKNN